MKALEINEVQQKEQKLMLAFIMLTLGHMNGLDFSLYIQLYVCEYVCFKTKRFE